MRRMEDPPGALVITAVLLLAAVGGWLVCTIFASAFGYHSAAAVTDLLEAGTLVACENGAEVSKYTRQQSNSRSTYHANRLRAL